MPQKQGKDGKFQSGDRKEHISLRLPVEVGNKLKAMPNTSKYIETVLVREMATQMSPPNPDWDYCQEWDAILDLIILGGEYMRKIQEYENRCIPGDQVVEGLIKSVENWVKHPTLLRFDLPKQANF